MRALSGFGDHVEGEGSDPRRTNLKVNEIDVETFKGVVQLSGFVATREEAAKAGTVARSIEGVTSVKNDIRLK